jgi:hypothetical protein
MSSLSQLTSIDRNEIVSEFDGTAAAGDRRGGTRNYAVYRACRVSQGQDQSIGIIRNTSEGGAEIQTLAQFRIGEEVIYDDPYMGVRTARVVWARADRIGVQNIATLQAVSDENRSRKHRAIRFELERNAKIWIHGKYEGSRLLNISQTGASFLLDRGAIDASIGTLASVSFDGWSFRPAILRWYQGAQLGLRFEKPLTLSELSVLLSKPSIR